MCIKHESLLLILKKVDYDSLIVLNINYGLALQLIANLLPKKPANALLLSPNLLMRILKIVFDYY